MSAQPRALVVLNVVSLILLAASYYASLVYAPLEAVMGAVQRVFYFHVATAKSFSNERAPHYSIFPGTTLARIKYS